MDTLQRAAKGGQLKRDPWKIADEGWGLVLGLATLELMGCLGPHEAAEVIWRGALMTMLAGLRQIG